MKNEVFIPTRGRHREIGYLCRQWIKIGFGVNLFVEAQECEEYERSVPKGVNVFMLPGQNRGIGFARNKIVEHAYSAGRKSIILADDDIKPATLKPARMDSLQAHAEHPKVLGITARYSYHDLAMGRIIKDWDSVVLLSTGMFRLVGLNVDNVMEIGNYDATLEYGEDCDLMLRSLHAGYPWMTHLGTWSGSIGGRYQPGGLLDFAGGHDQLAKKKEEWHLDLKSRWPDFINDHDDRCRGKQNCIRIQWKRAYDAYLPGWRKWSKVDGGDLKEYIDA